MIFDTFPREVGFPERMLIHNVNDYNQFVYDYNTIKSLYTTVYAFDKILGRKPLYQTAIIDKVFFDFDGLESHEGVKIFVKGLLQDNYKFIIHFSGGGFHIFVATKRVLYSISAKEFIKRIQKHLLQRYNIEKYSDSHVIGDISRICRIPNTLNVRRGRYCIPLYPNQVLDLTIDEIIELAQKPQYINNYGAGEFLAIPPENIIDDKITLAKFENSETYPVKIFPKPKRLVNDNENYPKCIEKILQRENPTHDERFLLVLYLSKRYRKGIHIERANIKVLTKRILNFFRRLKWRDWDEEITLYQINNILNKRYNNVPNCEWRKERKICKGCKKC